MNARLGLVALIFRAFLQRKQPATLADIEKEAAMKTATKISAKSAPGVFSRWISGKYYVFGPTFESVSSEIDASPGLASVRFIPRKRKNLVMAVVSYRARHAT